MKKWGFPVTVANLALILLGIGVNLLGRELALRLYLPFWLDSVGTFLSAVLLGPVAGAISGGLMNLIAALFDPAELWYSVVSIAGGFAVGWAFPRDRKIDSFSVIATALFTGFVMTVVSTPLNMYLNGGYVGHPWGDALVDMLSYYIDFRVVCCVAGELLVNMPDKTISILIAMSILYFVRKRREKQEEKKKTTDVSALALALVLLPAALAAALTVPASATADFGADYDFVVYGRSDGLVSSEINAIAQTSDGYIWAGAYSGLYRCNGSKFEQIQLDERIENAICLCEDDSGALWIGTNDSGLARYHADTGAIEFYTAADGLSSDSIRSLCEGENGCVYVGTTSELCRIDAGGEVHVYTKYPQINNISSLVNLRNGRVCGVTSRGLLFLIQDDKLLFSGQSRDPELSYSAVAYDDGGQVLVGTSGSELIRMRVSRSGSLEPLSKTSIQGLSDVNRIRYVQNQGGYFVASSMGIAFVDRRLDAEILTRDDFGSAASDVIEDYQGNIWFSSSQQGVMKLAYTPFTNISHKAGLESSPTNALLLDGGKLYVATDTGLEVLDEGNCVNLYDPISELFRGDRVRHLMKDSKGNLWVSTYSQSGLVRVAPDGTLKHYGGDDETVLGNRFRFTMELSDGCVLAASTDGLNFIENGRVTSVLSSEDGLVLPKILTAVECDDGTIYAGSDGDGIYQIKNRQVTGHIGTEEGLRSPVVLRLVRCGDGLLCVTSGGLYYREANGTLRRLENFPYKNDYDVCFSPDGLAWVSSSAGVYVTDTERMLADESGYSCTLLNHNWGFDASLTANAWNAVSDEALYLCCTDGVRRVGLRDFNELNSSFNIVISSFTDEGAEVEFRDGAYQIPSGRGRIQIRPAVLNYAMSDPLVSVTLEGTSFSETLQRQSEMTPESLTSLPYGDFRLRVRVLDELSGAAKKEAVFAMHKDAELYERVFFKLYCAFVSAMLVAFLAWTGAKMSNMAVIHRQYDQIREAKEEAEYANQAKSRFLAHMSHEIRTPINAVLGMDEMILRESTEPEIKGYAADIYTAGNTLLSLINDILDSSKIESGKMEIVPVEYELAVLIRDLHNMVCQRAQAKDLHLELCIEETLPRVLFGDDVRIRQVVTNILTNAVKYTPSGTVWFRVSGTREDGDAILRFEVEDTGIGIREEDLPKLFEAYQRIEEGRNRHIEGTGLGMAITVRLLDMMGSRLEVESVYGKGSKFYFNLRQKIIDPTPIGDFNETMHAPEERYSHEGAFIAPDARVLVVDDNAMNRKVFRSLLKVTQIQITEASGGLEALEIAKNERFDMVFMDHMMPDLDGVETMKRMRTMEGYETLPIYILTANAVTGAKEQYLEAGFDGFISKPVVSDKLEHAIRDALPPQLLKPFEPAEGAEAPSARESAGGSLPEDLPTVDGLDWNYAWLHLPERELLASTVRDFRETALLQADKLDRMYAELGARPGDAEALAAYRIHVHGMKSAAATIGIVPLAGMAKMLEFAARDGDTDTLARLHGTFVAEWRSYGEKLRGVLAPEEPEVPAEEKEEADADMLRVLFDMLRTALDDFDVDAADETVAKLRSYRCPPEAEAELTALAAAVTDLDQDAACAIMDRIESALSQNSV